MLSVAEARERILQTVTPLASERAPIDQAYDRVLAAPLHAMRDQPPFFSSAMDGYALPSTPAPGDFEIVGESAAGRAFPGELSAGQAVRISTGAPLPKGADGILIQEEATLSGARLVNAHVERDHYVRPRGGDFTEGALLLDRGRRLDPIAIALAASAGFKTLDVVRRPRVAVFAGGGEIVPPGAPVRADQVFESGSYAIAGLIDRWGGQARREALLPDDEAAIEDAARNALASADLVVLIGGASVGPHDHTRHALQRLGIDMRVEKVAVRPGKPTWFGLSSGAFVLGLPGNPASAIVTAYLFLRPLLAAMLGEDATHCVQTRQARLAKPLGPNGPREHYLRAFIDDDSMLHVLEDQDSSLLSVFARANALVVRAPNAAAAAPGDAASYLLL